MRENDILILSGRDLVSVLTMKDCIDVLREAFTDLSAGKVAMPLRTSIDMEPDNAVSLFMPAYSPRFSRVTVKTVMNNRNNPGKGLPFIHAMMMVFDSATGIPLALLDGEVITAMRTGAASGLASILLSRKNSRVAAIIGTGNQGETQLEAVCTARDIEKAYVFDLQQERAETFAEKMGEKLGIEIVRAGSLETLQEADIICTATPSAQPVFADSNLKKGVHINAVGSFRPDMVEIPPQTIARAKVVVDQVSSCLSEAGDLTQPIEAGLITADHIHGELGNLIAGDMAGRENEAEITVFKSVGVAAQDLVTADLAIRLAEQSGVGTRVMV